VRCILALAAMTVAGCALGPDYRRPEVPVPEAYEYLPQGVADTINTEWWKQFGDPVLERLISEALANNRSVMQAAANVLQAAAVLTEARSQFYPQAGYDAGGTRQQFSTDFLQNLPNARPSTARTQTTYSAIASASWEIDLWGRIRRQTEAARANLLATEEARRGVILSLVTQVANNYLTLRALDEQLAVAKKTLATYNESLKLFELQFQYGVVSQMNVAQAKSQSQTAAAQIPAIEQQIVATENALCILLGRNPGRIERGKAVADLTVPQTPAQLPSQLLVRRPDIVQAEQQLVAANAQIGAAKALYFPTISLTGAAGGISSDLSGLFSGPNRVWSYGGSLVGPLFTGGAVTAQVRQAEGAQQAALYNYEKTVQGAFADVENALIAQQKTRERLEAQKGLVDALSDYTRLARLQYNGGFVPYSTVLQAEQNLFPAELTLAQDRAQVFTALVSVYQSLGGGWVTIAEGMTTSAVRPIAAQSPAASAGGSGVTLNEARTPSRLPGGTMDAE
jgi:outer membrane protein, multidrug efflux system